MMAYDAGYVLAIIQDGFPVREINRKVHLPFNSEYKIRLKNKDKDLQAKARVFVDGRKVSNLGDFILAPGQTLDLERFLDQSMDEGQRFKFVPLSDSKVNDPTDSQNGLVKVEFYREQRFQLNRYPEKKLWPVTTTSPFTNGDRITLQGISASRDGGWHYQPSVTNCISSPGATVEGSRSDQQFVAGEIFLTDIVPTTLTLEIRGLEKDHYHPNEKTKKSGGGKIRFCSNCGRRRSKMADKFCPRCGSPYCR